MLLLLAILAFRGNFFYVFGRNNELLSSLEGYLQNVGDSSCDGIQNPLRTLDKLLNHGQDTFYSDQPDCFKKLITQDKRSDKMLPSYQCFLDFIVNVNQGLVGAIIKMQEDCGDELQTSLEPLICKETNGIAEVILEGNRKLVNTIVTNYHDSIDEMCEIMEKASKVEIEKTDTLITTINNDLLNLIQIRILKLKEEITRIVTDMTTFSLEEISTILTEANNSIYSQIDEILNDPKNDSPIISQLIFPEPDFLCPFITFTNNGMVSLIEEAFNNALKDVNSFIEKAEKMAITQVALVLNEGDKRLVDAFNDELNSLLVKVSETACKITKEEIIAIGEVITEISAFYLDGVKDNCDYILPDVEAQVVQMEDYILLESKKFLYCYNNTILHQMVPTNYFK